MGLASPAGQRGPHARRQRSAPVSCAGPLDAFSPPFRSFDLSACEDAASSTTCTLLSDSLHATGMPGRLSLPPSLGILTSTLCLRTPCCSLMLTSTGQPLRAVGFARVRAYIFASSAVATRFPPRTYVGLRAFGTPDSLRTPVGWWLWFPVIFDLPLARSPGALTRTCRCTAPVDARPLSPPPRRRQARATCFRVRTVARFHRLFVLRPLIRVCLFSLPLPARAPPPGLPPRSASARPS